MDGVWATLRSRLDYSSFVPTPVAGVERAALRRRDGSVYHVVKNPHGDGGAGTYLRLEPADLALFELMDGRRDVSQILVAHLDQSGVFALDRLARLTGALGANGFFGEARPDPYGRLRRRVAQRDPFVRLSLLLRRLIVWNIASWSNAEGAVDRLYRFGGRLFFTPLGAALLIVFSVAGLVTWTRLFASPEYQLFRVAQSYTLGLVALIVLQVLSISVHEAGHALAIRHFGRSVRRLGVAMYYLFPCAYVDSTDMVLASRRQRVVVALAGPFAGLAVAAVCAFYAAANPGTLAGGLAFQAATLFVFQFALNLIPILDLDGYHVLVDALDAPLLRQRAIGFVRGRAARKLRRRDKWTRGEIGLTLYGVGAIATSLLTLGFSLWLWDQRVGALAHELVAGGGFGLLLFALVVLVFVGPLLVALAARIAGLARTSIRLARARGRKQVERARAERVVVLDRVRFLNGLSRPALAAIADHVREEQVEAEEIVVTIGEPADRFYLVRSGRLEALAADGTVYGSIVPGEGFGELALLDQSNRTATVRAAEPSVLWSLGRGHFHRWVKDRYEVAARIRASAAEREVFAGLPFFRGLAGQELSRIAARLHTSRVPAGQAVIRTGDAPDRFYVIREGTAEVTLPDGTAVRRLGPGDTFGELGLLFGRPRSATVTAVTDLTLSSLGRADFATLVRVSGETMGEFRERTAHYVGAGLGGRVAQG